MAFNRAGGSFSFQQEQVAHPSLSSYSRPSTSNTNNRSAAASYSSSSSSASSFSNHHSSASSSASLSSARHPSLSYSSYSSSASSSMRGQSVNPSSSTQPFVDAQFDIFEWHVQYQSCVRYFLDHAQYSAPVQAVAAFVNIQLPFQRPVHPILASQPRSGTPSSSRSAATAAAAAAAAAVSTGGTAQPAAFVTLVPYIRRLIATAFDFPAVLHGFFGDDWMTGIGPIHETERRNYLFAAKSDNWLKVKADYDMDENQTVPFLRPLQNVSEDEIVNAETTWSEWLAMQDWMLGPRAPGGDSGSSGNIRRGVNIKREEY